MKKIFGTFLALACASSAHASDLSLDSLSCQLSNGVTLESTGKKTRDGDDDLLILKSKWGFMTKDFVALFSDRDFILGSGRQIIVLYEYPSTGKNQFGQNLYGDSVIGALSDYHMELDADLSSAASQNVGVTMIIGFSTQGDEEKVRGHCNLTVHQ